MLTSRSALAVLTVAGLSLAVVAREDPLLGDLPAAEECSAENGGSEECALSLRQLRARGATGAMAATPAAGGAASSPTSPPALVPEKPSLVPSPAVPAAEDPRDGVPGGWGEAAKFAHEVREEEALNATLKAQWSDFDDDGYGSSWAASGSCAAYGCIHYYAPWHACQCNSHCAKYGSCCNDYWHKCSHGHAPAPGYKPPAPAHDNHVGKKIMTLYHQTDQHAANLIKKYGFKPGREGWCGGAIYFAMSTKATETKAIGPQSHKGAMLECKVDVGKVMYLDRRCGGHAHNQAELDRKGYDSVSFNPGDGSEYVIYDKSLVLSIKQIPI